MILCDGGPPLCQSNQTTAFFSQHSLLERRKLQTTAGSAQNKIDGLGEGRGALAHEDHNTSSWYSGYDVTSLNHTSTYFLPFIPMKYNLDKSTIALNVSHPQSGYTQYNTHSLSGHMMALRM